MDFEELKKLSEELLEFSKSEEAKKLSKEEIDELNKKIEECMNSINEFLKESEGND